jgi:hypothetical protein
MNALIGTVNENSQIVINNHEKVKGFLSQYIGKEIEISFKKANKRRSAKQNRWYWGVAIKTIQEELLRMEGEPYEKEDIHHYILNEIVKAKFRTKDVMGKLITYTETKSTSAMTTKEFEVFKFQMQVHFSHKGIDIPDPNEDCYTNDYEPKRKTS